MIQTRYEILFRTQWSGARLEFFSPFLLDVWGILSAHGMGEQEDAWDAADISLARKRLRRATSALKFATAFTQLCLEKAVFPPADFIAGVRTCSTANLSSQKELCVAHWLRVLFTRRKLESNNDRSSTLSEELSASVIETAKNMSAALLPVVKRLAVRKDPPSLLVEYCVNTTTSSATTTARSSSKIRHRVVDLTAVMRKATNAAALPFAARQLLEKGPLKLFGGGVITESQLIERLDALLRLMRGGGGSQPHVVDGTITAAAASSDSRHGGQKADLGLLYRDPEKALKHVDLQDADDLTIKEYKKKMDDTFVKKILRPGDAGYVYDRRVDVKPVSKSEWDDD